ncbi:peptidoglycan DD-metalloendopeptidase family protein [Pseudokineococcus basanitobsidens]|uniref:Peptidoglycan DD-metalloendopeptidase family protein n=1 Tax=Pseudokineococcus basanitobsidens TaxID=1926649 RepID=A0ABU8RIK9_9ACTN
MTKPPTPGVQRCLLRPAAAALGLALAVSLASGGTPASAAPGDDARSQKQAVDQALGSVQEDLVGTSAELQGAYAEYAAVQAELPGARAAAEQARAEQAAAQAKADDLAQRLAASQTARTAAAQAVEETAADMAESQTSIGRIAASAYRSQGVPEGLSLAMGSGSTEEFASRTATVSSLSAAENDVLADLSADEAVRQSATARLTAVTEQVSQLKGEAEQQLAVAAQATRTAEDRQAEVEALVVRQQKAVDTIEARQAEEQARMAQLEAESDALGSQLREIAAEERRKEAARQAAAAAAAEAEAARRAASSGSSSGGSSDRLPAPSSVSRSSRDTGGTFLRPEGPSTSPFGMRMHPIKHYMKLHSGQDFAAACGTPVRAAEDGEIVSASYNGSYGNIAVINHGIVRGQPVATAYAHMQSFAKTSGSVSRGEVIGYEGSTGGSTGCHVHFEVRVNGEPVDPLGWL